MNILKQLAKDQKRTQLFLFLSSLFLAGTVIGQAYFFVSIVNQVFLEKVGYQQVLPLLGSLLIVLVARSLFTYLNGLAGIKMAKNVKRKIRTQLFEKYSRNPLQTSLKGQSGNKVSVAIDMIDELDGYFSKYIPQVIQTSIIPLTILIVVFYLHFPSGVIMMVTAPFIPIFYIIIGIMTQKKSEEQMDKMAVFSGRFLDTLQGLTTLKLFGQSHRQRESIRESSLQFRDATMEVLKVAFVSSLMLELISMLGIGIIALEIGLQLVVFKEITFFPAFFILVLAPEFYLALKDLGSAFHTGRGSMGAATKLHEELTKEEHPVEWGNKVLQIGAQPPTIEMNGVSFQYENEEVSVLQNIQASFPSAGQYAIVGRSGAGKSTMVNIMAGLLSPTSGDVRVNGENLSSYREESWFSQIGYLSQHPYLFTGTIAENIAIGRKDQTSREDIERAADQAGLLELRKSLKKGLDTPVGEGGRGLSGGEKQRVALARIFLKNPSIIFFDEPTTGLDLYTEKILQKSIDKLAKDAVVITVAHRLHTITQADQIFVLEHGIVEAQGTHKELVERSSFYRNMVSVQQRGNVQ